MRRGYLQFTGREGFAAKGEKRGFLAPLSVRRSPVGKQDQHVPDTDDPVQIEVRRHTDRAENDRIQDDYPGGIAELHQAMRELAKLIERSEYLSNVLQREPSA